MGFVLIGRKRLAPSEHGIDFILSAGMRRIERDAENAFWSEELKAGVERCERCLRASDQGLVAAGKVSEIEYDCRDFAVMFFGDFREKVFVSCMVKRNLRGELFFLDAAAGRGDCDLLYVESEYMS